MAPIPNPTSPAPTADLGPACAGGVSDSAAIAIAAAVTAVLKTLSIGDPSTRPFDETLRGGRPTAKPKLKALLEGHGSRSMTGLWLPKDDQVSWFVTFW
jgi:hypothetical protein